MRTFLQLDSNVVKARLNSASVPGEGPGLPSDFIEVTGILMPLGVSSWDELMGHTYDARDGSFTPPTPPPQTRRQQLKEQLTWTTAERDEAIRELL